MKKRNLFSFRAGEEPEVKKKKVIKKRQTETTSAGTEVSRTGRAAHYEIVR